MKGLFLASVIPGIISSLFGPGAWFSRKMACLFPLGGSRERGTPRGLLSAHTAGGVCLSTSQRPAEPCRSPATSQPEGPEHGREAEGSGRPLAGLHSPRVGAWLGATRVSRALTPHTHTHVRDGPDLAWARTLLFSCLWEHRSLWSHSGPHLCQGPVLPQEGPVWELRGHAG